MTRTEWLKKYPNHCRSCEARTDSANPCQECLGRLLCPRCMGDTLHPEDAAVPCSACGWVETEDHDHAAPLSRKDRAFIKREVEESIERDRSRRIREARETLAELGAE